MKMLIGVMLLMSVGGCVKPTVSQDKFSEPRSEAVKGMADKAMSVCGKGNVKSVTLSDFQCFDTTRDRSD